MARTERWRVVRNAVYGSPTERPFCLCHSPEDAARIVEAMNAFVLYPAHTWTEEDGDVLWWHLPVVEAPLFETPYIGRGIVPYKPGRAGDRIRNIRSGWLTHWSRIPNISGGQP